MHITRLANAEQWESLASCWNFLTRGNPFCSWEWLSTWWRYYGPGQELCVLAVRDDRGTLVGAAPWYFQHSGTRGRVLRMLGSGEVCSEYLSVLCTREFEDAVTDALANWITRDADGQHADAATWDLLVLECVPVTDSATTKFVANLVEAGCSLVRTTSVSCWRVELPDTWEAYLARLSRTHRKQLHRSMREHVDTGIAQLRMARNPAELQRDMEVLADLHRRRWLSQGQSGMFAKDRFAAFLRSVAPRLLQSETLQLSVLELDGRPSAVDFHLIGGNTNYVYQGGIEPELAKRSPGRLLTALLIREAIASGRGWFDFLRGDEAYKSHYRATPTATHDIDIVPRRAGSQIRHGIWRAGTNVKNLVKSGMSLTGMH